MEDKLKEFLIKTLDLKMQDEVKLYGERVGKGIQDRFAISEVPTRRFIVFFVSINGERVPIPMDLVSEELGIYHEDLFPTYQVVVDFKNPQAAADEMDRLTKEVNESCPGAKYFGIEGRGEGIVWTSAEEVLFKYYRFKTKSDKDKATKKKRGGVQITPDVMESITEFIESTVTENRLNQGLEYLTKNDKPISKASTGIFIPWVIKDILDEEKNMMEASGLSEKLVKSKLGDPIRKWFFDTIKNRALKSIA
jgi:hypothetical protein